MRDALLHSYRSLGLEWIDSLNCGHFVGRVWVGSLHCGHSLFFEWKNPLLFDHSPFFEWKSRLLCDHSRFFEWKNPLHCDHSRDYSPCETHYNEHLNLLKLYHRRVVTGESKRGRAYGSVRIEDEFEV